MDGLEARLSKIELLRMLKRCESNVDIEISVGGKRFPAVISSIYKAEDNRVRLCILAYGD